MKGIESHDYGRLSQGQWVLQALLPGSGRGCPEVSVQALSIPAAPRKKQGGGAYSEQQQAISLSWGPSHFPSGHLLDLSFTVAFQEFIRLTPSCVNDMPFLIFLGHSWSQEKECVAGTGKMSGRHPALLIWKLGYIGRADDPGALGQALPPAS